MLGLWLESVFLVQRRSHSGVSVLKFDCVIVFSSVKLFWRSVKLQISNGAASSSSEEVIYLPSLW